MVSNLLVLYAGVLHKVSSENKAKLLKKKKKIEITASTLFPNMTFKPANSPEPQVVGDKEIDRTTSS